MGRSVTKRKDGHFSVSGMPADVYYAKEATAKRIAANLDKADAEKAGKPVPPPKNQNQRAHGKATPATDQADDNVDADDNTDE